MCGTQPETIQRIPASHSASECVGANSQLFSREKFRSDWGSNNLCDFHKSSFCFLSDQEFPWTRARSCDLTNMADIGLEMVYNEIASSKSFLSIKIPELERTKSFISQRTRSMKQAIFRDRTGILERRGLSFRTIVVDLDGTLLNSDRELSETQAEYLRGLHSKGIQLVIATGRCGPNLFEIIGRLQIPAPIPVVCMNGARGMLCMYTEPEPSRTIIRHKVLFDKPLTQAAVENIVYTANQSGLMIIYYQDNNIFANPKLPQHFQLVAEYKRLTDYELLLVNDDFETLTNIDDFLPCKLQVLGVEDCEAFEDELDVEVAIDEGYKKGLGYYAEILDPEVNKGKGLERLFNVLGMSLEESIAFGDGGNDMEMLQTVGFGLAMKNAPALVKKDADGVTPWTNDQDGVMKTLQLCEKEGLLWYE